MPKSFSVLTLLISITVKVIAQLSTNSATVNLGDLGKAYNRYVIPFVNRSENNLILTASSGSGTFSIDIPQFIGPNQTAQVYLGRTERGKGRIREVLTLSDGKSSARITIKARQSKSKGYGCYSFNSRTRSGRAGFENAGKTRLLKTITVRNKVEENKTREVGSNYTPALHIVALVDVSGSMGGDSKLSEIKNQLRATHAALRPHDRLSILIYSEHSELVLENVPSMMKSEINQAIDNMLAGGFTNGGEGITSAVEYLKKHEMPGTGNQIILFTDGDFNLGSDHTQVADYLDRELTNFPFIFSVVTVGSSQKNSRQMKEISRRCGGQYWNYVYNSDKELFMNQLLRKHLKI